MFKEMRLATLIVYCLTICVPTPLLAAEYVFVKNDTLWNLAEQFLTTPWDWPLITNVDGSVIEDVNRIPVGYTVKIPKYLIKHEILEELDSSPDRPQADIIKLDDMNTKTLIQNPFHYLMLTKNDGLVRAYLNDRHVTISIPLLIEQIKQARPNLEIRALGNGIAISNKLVKELLNIK